MFQSYFKFWFHIAFSDKQNRKIEDWIWGSFPQILLVNITFVKQLKSLGASRLCFFYSFWEIEFVARFILKQLKMIFQKTSPKWTSFACFISRFCQVFGCQNIHSRLSMKSRSSSKSRLSIKSKFNQIENIKKVEMK